MVSPESKRSIRQIPMPKSRKAGHERDMGEEPYREHGGKRGSRTRIVLWLGGALAAIVLIVAGMSLLFSGAKVTVTPKTQAVNIDGTFTAKREGASLTELPYEVMTLEREGTKVLPVGKEEQVERKASGKIVVYNDYSSAPQRLIANTRFETTQGLIYRIQNAVTVPGQTTQGGKKVPGNIEVTVYADKAGAQYNVGLTDFSIPGFKGDPRYEKFYARSKTPMTGGASGITKVVDPAQEQAALQALSEELRQALLTEAEAQKPQELVLMPDGAFTESQTIAQKPVDQGVELSVRTTLHAVLVDPKKLAEFIARQGIERYAGDPVTVPNLGSLQFAILNRESVKPWSQPQFSFTAKGSATVVWKVNTEQLKDDLAGKSKRSIVQVLPGYPAIEKAKVVLRPFWRDNFPETTKDITVQVVTPES